MPRYRQEEPKRRAPRKYNRFEERKNQSYDGFGNISSIMEDALDSNTVTSDATPSMTISDALFPNAGKRYQSAKIQQATDPEASATM